MIFDSPLVAVLAATAAFFSLTSANENNTFTKRANLPPVMGGQNFPDPATIRVADGWHFFSTNAMVDGKRIHVQKAFSPDFKKFTFKRGQDAMPKLAPWIQKSNPRIWAPDVIKLPNGKFILYYSAALKSKPKIHCLGVARADRVDGPYVDNSKNPWICPSKKGGAIDSSGYLDPTSGKRWVVYKIDGNAIGRGGVCGNTVKPIVGTPILLQQVNARDGVTKIGAPVQLITNGPLDGPVVEAPTLTRLGGKYVLFFSSNCFATPKYDVAYATSNNVGGPYKKYGPLFVTGNLGMTAPGGLDINENGDKAVWHANWGKGRAMFKARLSQSGNLVRAHI
ncbi:hypothetical protein MBLNU230_g3043t1 [Neophaeotheca triangularis]